MNLIAAADKNWAIGKNNSLLVNIPGDMKVFRELTLNKIVITGRKTMETFQNGNPLLNRINIVVSSDTDLKIKNAYVVNSIDEVMEKLDGLYEQGYKSEDVFVIGGESIYKQMEEFCDYAYITKIDHSYEADAFFPDLDESKEWQLVRQSEEQTYFDLEYAFLEYKKI